MKYTGVIVEESLENTDVLRGINIVSTEVELVTEEHNTPWINKWTMHTAEVPEDEIAVVVEKLCVSLIKTRPWYADFKNDQYHYIVFSDKVFRVDLTRPVLYQEAKVHGLSLGIPEYQLDFTDEEGDEDTKEGDMSN